MLNRLTPLLKTCCDDVEGYQESVARWDRTDRFLQTAAASRESADEERRQQRQQALDRDQANATAQRDSAIDRLEAARAALQAGVHDELSQLSRVVAVVEQTPHQEMPSAANAGQVLLEHHRSEGLQMDLVGLALSGGGIRSATFALGVLQALAKLRLLGCFDYLSTVSGGGYIGGWLAAWVQRERSLTNVEKQLDPSRVSQDSATRTVQVRPSDDAEYTVFPFRQTVDEEPEPIYHLRSYSRYLTPRAGLFSLDTWTLAAIYFRNLFVNLLILVPLAVLAVVLARCVLVGQPF